MSKTHPPQLKLYMDKYMLFKLNGNRKVTGVLRGFDPFMNLIVEEAKEHPKVGEPKDIGMVVVRGSSIITMEPQQRLDG